MLTNSYQLTRAQQKKLKNQFKWGSCIVLMLLKSYLARMNRTINRSSGSIQALQQEDSSFKGETTLPKTFESRLMGLD